MARHRHAVNVRADGLAAVLGPLLRDARVLAAALVDVDSGMVLDSWCAPTTSALPGPAPDLELIGAQHAEVVRGALALLREWPQPGAATGPPGVGPVGAEPCEVVLGPEDGVRHLLRTVPDPYGDRLALAVVVHGPQRVLDRVRKRLRSVAVDALTAGPTMTRRPERGVWRFAMPGPDVPADTGPAGSPAEPPPLPDPAAVGPDGYTHDGYRHDGYAAAGHAPHGYAPAGPAPREPGPVPPGFAVAPDPVPSPPVAAPPFAPRPFTPRPFVAPAVAAWPPAVPGGAPPASPYHPGVDLDRVDADRGDASAVDPDGPDPNGPDADRVTLPGPRAARPAPPGPPAPLAAVAPRVAQPGPPPGVARPGPPPDPARPGPAPRGADDERRPSPPAALPAPPRPPRS